MASIQITIIEARNLKKMDLLSESDAFIEIYLNHKSPKYRTKVIPNSQNPHWNETVVLNQFKGQDTLYVDIYDEDPLKNDKIGSIKIDLRDLYEKRIIDTWYDIPSHSYENSHGEVHLILEYQPQKH